LLNSTKSHSRSQRVLHCGEDHRCANRCSHFLNPLVAYSAGSYRY
jgi:hypothetical protein